MGAGSLTLSKWFSIKCNMFFFNVLWTFRKGAIQNPHCKFCRRKGSMISIEVCTKNLRYKFIKPKYDVRIAGNLSWIFSVICDSLYSRDFYIATIKTLIKKENHKIKFYLSFVLRNNFANCTNSNGTLIEKRLYKCIFMLIFLLLINKKNRKQKIKHMKHRCYIKYKWPIAQTSYIISRTESANHAVTTTKTTPLPQ